MSPCKWVPSKDLLLFVNKCFLWVSVRISLSNCCRHCLERICMHMHGDILNSKLECVNHCKNKKKRHRGLKLVQCHWFTKENHCLEHTCMHMHGGILNSKLECVNHCKNRKKSASLTKIATVPLVYKRKSLLRTHMHAYAWRHSKFQTGERKPLQIQEKK